MLVNPNIYAHTLGCVAIVIGAIMMAEGGKGPVFTAGAVIYWAGVKFREAQR